MRIQDYIVLQEEDNMSLGETVMRYIRKGWTLQGGVSLSVSESDDFCYTYFSQAMIKVEPMGKMP